MKTAVVGVVVNGGLVLVGKKLEKKESPLNNCWHIPGGMVEGTEEDTAALVREIKEESNIDVEVIKKFGSVTPRTDLVVNWYLCKPVTFDLRPGDDLVDAKFVPLEEVTNVCDPKAVSLWPDEVKAYFMQVVRPF